MIIAHRGFCKDVPENTLAAFQKAVKAGAHMIELDVRTTSDGHPVVFHDHTLYRTTAQRGIIEMLTLNQVRKLNVGPKQTDRVQKFRVPTLEEVLIFAKDKVLLNIELKTTGTEKAIVKLIEKHDMLNKVVVSSFRFSSLKKVRELQAEVKIGCIAFFLAGFSEIAEKLAPYSVHLWTPLVLSDRPVRRAHQQGIRVYLWHVNAAAQFRRLTRLGIDGVITDAADLLVDVLPEKSRRIRPETLPPPLIPASEP
ncbi:MAG: glycerophosphodiester phosphodiesterase family protein [bacterium]